MTDRKRFYIVEDACSGFSLAGRIFNIMDRGTVIGHANSLDRAEQLVAALNGPDTQGKAVFDSQAGYRPDKFPPAG
jgi:hypothetical protein